MADHVDALARKPLPAGFDLLLVHLADFLQKLSRVDVVVLVGVIQRVVDLGQGLSLDPSVADELRLDELVELLDGEGEHLVLAMNKCRDT